MYIFSAVGYQVMKDGVLVGESFGNIQIHFHRMPYDVEIKNDVNIIAI